MEQLIKLRFLIFILIALFLCTVFSCIKEEPIIGDINFNKDWKFSLDEITEAINPNFDDSTWETINVPHDWSIKGPFSKDNPAFSRGAWLPTGKCTYRKIFTVDANAKENKVFIYFDGVYRNSTVYINGHKIGFRPFGYIGFEYDLTKHINFKGKNVLTVTLDNSSQPASRWYTGTGIYRDVTLKVRNKIYIPNWSLYVTTPKISEKNAKINTAFKIKNELGTTGDIIVKTSITNNDSVIGLTENKINITSNSVENLNIPIDISNPELWSPESPNLYLVKVQLFKNGQLIGEETTKTGIRKLGFDKDTGFSINGVQTKLKGVCLHHGGGPLGSAIYKRTIQRQLEILREMGCNAVRTAHNPFSTEFLNVCDEMGFLVMNEAFDEWEIPKEPMTIQNGKKIRIPIDFYASKFKEWADKDLTDFVLRDRNHPSVIMWSIGNEIDQMKIDEGAPIANRLIDIIHKLDYRPVTNGVNGYGWNSWPSDISVATSDIKGYNYITETGLKRENEIDPDAMGVVTECQSAQSFYPRSTYLYGQEKEDWWNKLNYKYKDAYNWVAERELIAEPGIQAWRDIKNRPNIMGQFIWTGWDYLGEVIPYGWPARSAPFAPIDLCGFPKDGYYFYQSQWSAKPMVHIFPHWNLKGQEGKEITVYAFTNGDEVELFQDGKSLGRKKNNPDDVEYQTWQVVYHPGELKAISYNNGKQAAEKIVKTTGEPAKIKLFARRENLTANGKDLSYIECTILDKDGNVVPTAANLINFNVEGEATLIGVGNGDNFSHDSFQANSRKAFNGKCLAIIKTSEVAGKVKFTASSDGLEPALIEFNNK